MRLLLPLVCLIAGCLAAVPPQALAQGAIRVDTIFRSVEPRIKPLNFLQVHGDTVVMIVGDLADPGGWLFRSLDRGDTWDSLRMTYPNEPQMPGNGLYIFGMLSNPSYTMLITRDGWTVTKDYPSEH